MFNREMFSDAEIQVIAEMLQVSSWLSAWDPGTGADAAMVDPAFMASDVAGSVRIDVDSVGKKIPLLKRRALVLQPEIWSPRKSWICLFKVIFYRFYHGKLP